MDESESLGIYTDELIEDVWWSFTNTNTYYEDGCPKSIKNISFPEYLKRCAQSFGKQYR